MAAIWKVMTTLLHVAFLLGRGTVVGGSCSELKFLPPALDRIRAYVQRHKAWIAIHPKPDRKNGYGEKYAAPSGAYVSGDERGDEHVGA
jgi:hypothetical protein